VRAEWLALGYVANQKKSKVYAASKACTAHTCRSSAARQCPSASSSCRRASTDTSSRRASPSASRHSQGSTRCSMTPLRTQRVNAERSAAAVASDRAVQQGPTGFVVVAVNGRGAEGCTDVSMPCSNGPDHSCKQRPPLLQRKWDALKHPTPSSSGPSRAHLSS